MTFGDGMKLKGRPVSECGGRNANRRHFTLDTKFTLCGEPVRVRGSDWGFNTCSTCEELVPHAEAGMWFDFNKPGWVRVMRAAS